MTNPVSARSSRLRLFLLVLLGLAGAAATGVIYQALRVSEDRVTRISLYADAGRRVGVIRRELAVNFSVLDTLAAYYDGSENVEPDEFPTFAARFLKRHPGLTCLAVAARVESPDRPHLTFPVKFLEANRSGRLRLGSDLYADPLIREAIDRATRSGRLTATAARPRGQSDSGDQSIMVIAPIYRKRALVQTADQRAANLEWIGLGEFVVNTLVEAALEEDQSAGIDVVLCDATPGTDSLLWARDPQMASELLAAGIDEEEDSAAMVRTIVFGMAGRVFSAYCIPTKAYLAEHKTLLPPAMLGMGALVTVLLVLFGATAAGRTAKVEREVVQRTLELQQANAALAQEVVDRERAEMVLKDSEALYSSLVENLPVQMLRKDLNGRFTFANESFCHLLGKHFREIIGKNDFDFYPRDLADKYREDDAWVAATGDLFEDTEKYEKNGDTRFVHVMKSAVRDATGKIIGTQAVFWDVTERTQAEEQMEHAKAAAEAANRAKSVFLANMSHEIRTPLNAVLGMSELVLETRLSAEQREYLTVIRESSEALLSLVNDVLDFSKIEAGKLDLDLTPFDLHEGLGDALKSLAHRAHRKGLELVCSLLPGVPEMVVGDSTRLRQVIVNLVGNAIKFTERGEVVLEAQCESRTTEDVVLHFAVSDTGIGIPAEKCEAIFGAFVQGDSTTTRKFGGTGLGLAIASRLVEVMGGRMWLESELGQGSKFHFTCRFGLLREETAGPLPPLPAGIAGTRVLVVDDNSTTRRLLDHMLAGWEMTPTVVGSAAEAESLLRQSQESQPYPLVLLDATMPETDGFALCQRIRRGFRSPPAIVMMLSSGDRPGDISRCEQLQVDAYVLKPIKHSELFDAIAMALGLTTREEEGGELPSVKKGGGLPPLRVLLAEDSLVNQKLIVALLERQGHRVVVASNGKEAAAAFYAQPFDVILMDIQMPEVDGLEATAAIRQAEKQTGTRVPIIAMTAHAMQGDRERCLAAGMDQYLSKPIRARRLFETIEALVGSAGPAEPVGEAASESAQVSAASAPTTTSEDAGRSIAGQGLVDWDAALAAVGGDPQLLEAVVRTFLEESSCLMTGLRQTVAGGIAESVMRCAHTLKGSVNYFGAQRVFDLAYQLETAGRERHLDDAPGLLASLEEEMARLSSVLSDYLGNERVEGRA